MSIPRRDFAAATGPDKDATGAAPGVNGDPRVYVFGGIDDEGNILNQCEKYNPNTDSWTSISPLPKPLANSSAAFAPDYSKPTAVNLGYIYVAGGGENILYRYDIKEDTWGTSLLPFSPISSTLTYLDDFGGPLAELFVATTGVDLPACTDTQTLWSIGGEGTEQEAWVIESNTTGELVGEWSRGPDLPLFRSKPLIGRTFWRDAGITSFGVSNCASIVVAGGYEVGSSTAASEVQLLIRNVNCDWAWITPFDNDTNIPNSLLTLAIGVANGAFGTEQWPETLVTGGRPILFGGEPKSGVNGGSTQFGQFRFSRGRWGRDICLIAGDDPNSAWNTTTSMPGQRVGLRALPLSQENSSVFGGRRVSRFLCVGGVDIQSGAATNRVQLFQLPVPSAFLLARENDLRCNSCRSKKSKN